MPTRAGAGADTMAPHLTVLAHARSGLPMAKEDNVHDAAVLALGRQESAAGPGARASILDDPARESVVFGSVPI